MEIRVMKAEDYDKLYELWMTIKGFGIRSIDDSREGVAEPKTSEAPESRARSAATSLA